MILEAVLLTPARLATGAFVVVTQLGFDQTTIALGETLHAGITITLVETLAGLAPAIDAIDLATVLQVQWLTNERIHRHPALANRQRILNGVGQCHLEFA